MEVAAIKLALSTLSPVIKKLGSYVFDSYFEGDVAAEEMINHYEFVRLKIAAVIKAAELDHSDQLMPLLEKLQVAVSEAEDLLDLYEYKLIENQQVSSSSNPIEKLALAPKFKESTRFMLIKSNLRIDYENLLKFVNQVEKNHPTIKLIANSPQKKYKTTQASSSIPTTSTPSLVDAENQIISKVKSSPLALKVAGRFLREQKNFNEWENVLKQDMLKGTMDLFLFSFQHLPSHLQRCFAYCSLFPKGYQFTIFPYYHEKQHLIPLWIAQGYVENDKSGRTLEEIGSIYIEELISYSFFEKCSDDYFIIHDLLHDLAENVSKGRCHRIENHGSLNIPTTCIHLSICEEELEELDLEDIDISKFNNLRTLIIFDPSVSEYIFINKKNIFLNLIKLRALHIEQDFELMDVLSGPHLDKLKHLRYLYVNFDKELPRSLTKLYHLQFCDLMFTTFHIEKNSVNGMKSLKNLPFCASLSIMNLENIKSKEEAAEAMLNQKKNLNKLTLEWSNSPGIVDNSSTYEEVLDALEPPPSLETLRIIGYQGVKVANWMIKENWLPRLRILNIKDCDYVESLPNIPMSLYELWITNCAKLTTLPMNLEKLTSLKALMIGQCDEVESLPNMPMSLEELRISNCAKLTALSMNLAKLTSLTKLNIGRCNDVESLPNMPMSLKKLDINYCGKLTTLPMNLEKLTSLEYLRIEYHNEVESLPNMPMSLKKLHIIYCAKLTTLPMNLEKLTSLENLWIVDCHDVESLPNLPMSLKYFSMVRCPKLKVNYEEGGRLRHTISHIPSVYIG